MSYAEDAIYSFIKDLLTKGVIILKNKRFIFYTTLAIILPLLLTIYSFTKGPESATVYNNIYRIELSTCASMIITGIISMKTQLKIKKERLLFIIIAVLFYFLSSIMPDIFRTIENIITTGSFYSWIITTNIAGLIVIREFVVSWPGWIMRLGDKDDRLMFSPIIKIGVYASIAWFIYSIFTNFSISMLLAFIAGAIALYTIYVFMPLTKDKLMSSILCFFYFMLLYHLFVRAENSTGFIILDITLIVLTTILTAQGLSNLIASKKHAMPYKWDCMIIILLGLMQGYHLLAVKIALISGLEGLYSLYHDISFVFGTMIMLIAIILYTSNKQFRQFSQNKITMSHVAEKLSTASIETITNYAKSIKETIKNKGWTFEIRKKEE